MVRKKYVKKIVLTVPAIVGYIGIIDFVIFSMLTIYFIFTTKGQLHWSFYLFYGLFISVSMFMIILSIKWKVIVKKDDIVVYPLIGEKYSFSFDEIISIERQVKRNRKKSERVIIKTNTKKKLIVESAHISYFKFILYLLEMTEPNIRCGFEDFNL